MQYFRTIHKAIRLSPHRLIRCMAAIDQGTKRKMSSIGTHSGSFHCDEALGCWFLQRTERFKAATITRSRDPEILKDCDVVIDVSDARKY